MKVCSDDSKAIDLVDLKDWARVRSWSAAFDEGNTVTLTKGNKTIVVPLGGGTIQVNGKWIEVPDVVVERDGHWLVPMQALEAQK